MKTQAQYNEESDRREARRAAEYERRRKLYLKLARANKDFAVDVTGENDSFYMRCTRKQAMECINSGMVARVNEHGVCLIDKHDHSLDFQG